MFILTRPGWGSTGYRIVSGNDVPDNSWRSARLQRRGFTLIELLVVLAILATLLTLALPRYFGGLEKSKEAVLRHDLRFMREAIDKYYGDSGKYPENLDDLTQKKYLRSVPVDPLTDSAETWVVTAPEDPDQGSVFDVHSGAEGNGLDGIPYKEW